MSPKGIEDFKHRVKRINNPRNMAYFDPDLGMHIPKHVSQDTIRRNAKARKPSFVAFMASLLIGAGALVGAQALRFRYLQMTEISNATLFTDLLLATLFVLTLSGMMRYRMVRYRVAQMAGVVTVLVAGHNLVWYYPDAAAVVYTADYVQIVRETTAPMSLVFRDTTYGL